MTPVPLKKITVAEVFGYGRPADDAKLKAPTSHVHLLYVYGAVTSAVAKPSKFNPNEKVLIGRFEAVRVSDRQQFTAERLYLPDRDYQLQLATACAPNAETGEVNEPEFGFMIGYRPGNSPQGYVFTCEPMTDTRVQDRLANVRKLLSDSDILKRFNLPQLAAPAEASNKKK